MPPPHRSRIILPKGINFGSVFQQPHRAALDQNLRPQRGERLPEAGSAIGDNELRRPQAAFDEVIEVSPPGGLTLSAHVLDREENLLAVPPHAEGDE